MVKADGDVHRKRLFESVHGESKMILWIYESLQSVKDNVMGLKKADDAVTDTDDEAANELANCFQRMSTKDDGVDQGNHRRLRFSSDADIVRLTNARIIIIIIIIIMKHQRYLSGTILHRNLAYQMSQQSFRD